MPSKKTVRRWLAAAWLVAALLTMAPALGLFILGLQSLAAAPRPLDFVIGMRSRGDARGRATTHLTSRRRPACGGVARERDRRAARVVLLVESRWPSDADATFAITATMATAALVVVAIGSSGPPRLRRFAFLRRTERRTGQKDEPRSAPRSRPRPAQ
ncbi:MAG: hypothetical protein JO090_03205 [Rhizobacter sp.]|nr:hypothetical protein [Rhizobacter sp.]